MSKCEFCKKEINHLRYEFNCIEIGDFFEDGEYSFDETIYSGEDYFL